MRDAGQMVEIRVLGLATIANDVSAELALATSRPSRFSVPSGRRGGEDRTDVADGLTHAHNPSHHSDPHHTTSTSHGIDADRRPMNNHVQEDVMSTTTTPV